MLLLLLTKKRAGASQAAGRLPAGGGPGTADFSQTVLATLAAQCTVGVWGTQGGSTSEGLMQMVRERRGSGHY